MMNHKFIGLFLATLILGALSLPAQTLRLEVKGPAHAQAGQEFQVKYTIATASGLSHFQSPTWPAALKLLSGPNPETYSSYSNVNGRVRGESRRTYTFTFLCERAGSYTLSSASISHDGQTLTSSPLTLRVAKASPSSSAAKDREAADGLTQSDTRPRDDISFHASLSRPEVYVQQPVLLTLTASDPVGGLSLHEPMPRRKPDFPSIVSYELPCSMQLRTDHEAGRTVKRTDILQYLLYPQRAGNLALPSLPMSYTGVWQPKFANEIEAMLNSGNICSVPLEKNVSLPSLRVLPLPEPQPAGFSGAVGKFTARLERSSASTPAAGSSQTLRLTITGSGNLRLITPPRLAWPTPSDVDAPSAPRTDTPQTKLTPTGEQGSVSFLYSFSPRHQGTLHLPPLRFVYFDPEARAYKTITLPSQSLEVGARRAGSVPASGATSGFPRLMRSDAEAREATAPLSLPMHFLSLFGVLTAGLALIYGAPSLLRRLRDLYDRRRHTPLAAALRILSQAQRGSQHTARAAGTRAASATAQALTTYLSMRWHIPPHHITKDTIRLRLQGATDADRAELLSLWDECEAARYAGQNSDAEESLPRRGASLLRRLERTLPALLLLLSSWSVPASLSSATPPPAQPLHTVHNTLPVRRAATLDMADSAYLCGSWAEASRLYRQAEQSDLASMSAQGKARLHYNLALSLLRQDSLAPAVLHLERCLLLTPRNAEARRALQIAGARLEDHFQPPVQMFFVSWMQHLLSSRTSAQWGRLALWLLLGALLCLLGARVLASRGAGRTASVDDGARSGEGVGAAAGGRLLVRVLRYGAVLCMLLLLTAETLTLLRHAQEQPGRRAVVMTPVHTYPLGIPASGTKAPMLHPGTTVRLEPETSLDSLRRVRLPSGRYTYCAERALQPI